MSPTLQRPRRWWYRAGELCTLSMAAAVSVQAQTAAQSCAVGASGLACRLGSALHLLYAVAVVLGLLLAVILGFTVRAFRSRSSRDSLPR